MRKKNNYRAKRRVALAANYWERVWRWKRSEPPRWRVIKWLQWRRQKPVMPKWLKEDQEWQN